MTHALLHCHGVYTCEISPTLLGQGRASSELLNHSGLFHRAFPCMAVIPKKKKKDSLCEELGSVQI